ncbi:MAG: hypothetical protein RBS37_13715 [Bacteroidales bacterium]|jgi:hypothetical protein|nr:hypothetical protein [Bacteroidales bacterium]
MKKNAILIFGLFAMLTMFSCSKDKDPVNTFTYDGEEYFINDVYLIEEVFGKGTAEEMHVFQFMFGNIKNGDTTMVPLAVLDPDVKTLGGNYPSIGYTDETERCLYPFGLFFLSGISLENGDYYYLTGEGGSVDVEIGSDGIYSVSFSDVSVGEYESFGDNATYTEIGVISGSYEGVIHKEVEVVGADKKSSVARTRLNSLLEQVK